MWHSKSSWHKPPSPHVLLRPSLAQFKDAAERKKHEEKVTEIYKAFPTAAKMKKIKPHHVKGHSWLKSLETNNNHHFVLAEGGQSNGLHVHY